MLSTSIHALLTLTLVSTSVALLEEKFVAFKPALGAVPIHNATIIYAAEDPVGVKIAATSLVEDLAAITGKKLELSPFGVGDALPPIFRPDNEIVLTPPNKKTSGSAVLAGTVESKLIRQLVSAGKLNVTDIAGRWETFKTIVVEQPIPGVSHALVIAGSDKRAVMFGIYTLAEQCGQSPFHWWADVPAKQHDEIYAVNKTVVFGEPSVKYRGLFINDEAPGLTGWWSKVHGEAHQPLDTEFYRHVFDMLVRLKGNFMWPASWKSWVPKPGNVFFTDDPSNMELANDYGIVISTSHHEPMQRATNEWDASRFGPWDWAKNKQNVVDFMREGVRRAANNESYFTLGMRSAADGPIEGNNPLELLKEVFEVQRQLIADYHGSATGIPQMWTIYKEVMTYYAAGLVPPDDVTLMFTDDNWGNIQRLPIDNEADRTGGIGMYYHLQYTGIPKSYKWQNTNNLAKIYKELWQAYERGVDRVWVTNVGDIKPVELPFSLIMEMSWNMDSMSFETLPDYLEAFATREFDVEDPTEVASIMMRHSQLIGRRKYESTVATTYSVVHYFESERVLREWKELSGRVQAVAKTLPDSRRAAFWHHVEYPVEAGYAYHETVLNVGINQHIGWERRNTANAVAQQALDAFERDYDLLEKYDSMLDGKWAGMLSQPHFDPYYSQTTPDDWWEPTSNAVAGLWYVQMRENASYNFGNLGIYAESSWSAHRQGRNLPSAIPSGPMDWDFRPILSVMDPQGKGVWHVDLFHRGDHRVPITWSISSKPAWLTVAPASGQLMRHALEQRLNFTVDWDAVPPRLDQWVYVGIKFDTSPWFDQILMPIMNFGVPDDFVGFPESQSFISIEAPHFQRRSAPSASGVTYEHIPHLGTRSDSGSIALRPYKAARADRTAGQEAWVEYDFYLYYDTEVWARIYINGALDTDPTLLMEFSLTVDDNDDGRGDRTDAAADWRRVLGTPGKPGDTPPGWAEHVADHVWMPEVRFGRLAGGRHTLRWRSNSPEVYLEKIALDTRGGLRDSYLGPPETRMVTGKKRKESVVAENAGDDLLVVGFVGQRKTGDDVLRVQG
ncbi:glycosyl hydrolase 115 family protein [Microdochium nivale]|nr:glycosyl hydrolase 115 family protein [Microdochium nivale]